MLTRALILLLLTSVFSSPVLARDPANPNEPVPPAGYRSVVSGTKSFRPVEPMPWGDVNRRVMPPDAKVPSPPGQGEVAPKGNDQKSSPHGQH